MKLHISLHHWTKIFQHHPLEAVCVRTGDSKNNTQHTLTYRIIVACFHCVYVCACAFQSVQMAQWMRAPS